MKGIRILVAAILLVLLIAAIFWWLQRSRTAEQAKTSALVFNEQPSEVASPPAQRKESVSPPQLAVVSDESGAFTVQISSWRSSAKAEREAERFRSVGYKTYVQRAYLSSPGEVWYRVRVGHFSVRSEAERQARELEAQLESGFWITQKQ